MEDIPFPIQNNIILRGLSSSAQYTKGIRIIIKITLKEPFKESTKFISLNLSEINIPIHHKIVKKNK